MTKTVLRRANFLVPSPLVLQAKALKCLRKHPTQPGFRLTA